MSFEASCPTIVPVMDVRPVTKDLQSPLAIPSSFMLKTLGTIMAPRNAATATPFSVLVRLARVICGWLFGVHGGCVCQEGTCREPIQGAIVESIEVYGGR